VSLPADVFFRGMGFGSGVRKLLLCTESRGVSFWWAMSIDLMGKAERKMEPAANKALARRPREVERGGAVKDSVRGVTCLVGSGG
jgi:hypothetical protein